MVVWDDSWTFYIKHEYGEGGGSTEGGLEGLGTLALIALGLKALEEHARKR